MPALAAISGAALLVYFVGYLPRERTRHSIEAAAAARKVTPPLVNAATVKLAAAREKLLLPGNVTPIRAISAPGLLLRSWRRVASSQAAAPANLTSDLPPPIDPEAPREIVLGKLFAPDGSIHKVTYQQGGQYTHEVSGAGTSA